MRRNWHVALPVSHTQLSCFPDLSPLLVQVLYDRGIVEPGEVRDFLVGHWSADNPFTMCDMPRAVDVLIRAIKRREPIAVYGDFDVDGVTATALLVQTLTGLGADVQAYIPSRIEEGYGLNIDALRKLYGQGIRLVVTVDCGIRAVDEIEQARRGLEFVITDHHSVGPEIPFASAVLNPKRADCAYPFKELSGVGVAYKLAQALIREASTSAMPVHVEEEALLDLVALGTVADMVPLLGENRHLVQRGLQVINEARREGVRALLRAARVRVGDVSAATIGFALGPRLNAAGRIDDAALSYHLLVTCDPAEADQLARKLDEQNRLRQDMTARTYACAEQMALQTGQDTPILYAASGEFNSGIVGLVAGKLTEAYYRPAIVVERGDGVSKGSCRSIPGFHITQALDECRHLLVRHGGHAAAAGFTVLDENLDQLIAVLSDIARRELRDKDLTPILNVDAEVGLSEMDWAVSEWLRRLEPCGYANPAPLFLSRGVSVLDKRTVGGEGQHLKLKLGENRCVFDAIGFSLGERIAELGLCVDVVYSLEVNEWQGERNLQLNVQDIRPALG
ncbi:MAG: single-stranded-DNA-specific exonuclease RecJ [Anaerolineae bacterium]|nr:single-stranded-DNA-specific exonuclease RecJ [Anaerolineae bacterium]